MRIVELQLHFMNVVLIAIFKHFECEIGQFVLIIYSIFFLLRFVNYYLVMYLNHKAGKNKRWDRVM